MGRDGDPVNVNRMLIAAALGLAMTATTGCGKNIAAPMDVPSTGGPYGGTGSIAQPTGTVTGRVVDATTGLGVPGVQITLMSGGRSTVTDAAGEYTLTQVVAAKQKLSIFKADYTYVASNGDVLVDVLAGSTLTAPDIKLMKGSIAQTNAFAKAFTNLPFPQQLAYDATHNYVYTVAKTNLEIFGITTPEEAWQVKCFDADGGLIRSFGESRNLLLNESKHIFDPKGMTCDAGGNVFLTDPSGVFDAANPIKRYDLAGNLIMPNKNSSYFAGANAPFEITYMPHSSGFAVAHKGGVTLYNSSGGAVKTIPSSTTVTAIAVDADDNLYLIDSGSQQQMIKKYAAPDYSNPAGFGSRGEGWNQFLNPTDLAVDNRNGDFYVVDSGNNRIVRCSSQMTQVSWFGGMGAAAGSFNKPSGVVVDKAGYVYVSDTNNSRIQKFYPSPLRAAGQNQ